MNGAGSGVVGTLLDDAVLAGTELVLASTVELGAELLVLSSTIVFATVAATVESGFELLVETPVVSGLVESTMVESTMVESTTVESTTVESTTVESTTVEPIVETAELTA